MTYYSQCGWAPFELTAKKKSKEEICGVCENRNNENFNRMYVDSMMKKKTQFYFNLGEKKYYFEETRPLDFNSDRTAILTRQIPGAKAILECFDDGPSTDPYEDRCWNKQFYSVHKILPRSTDGNPPYVTEQECKALHSLFQAGDNKWERPRDGGSHTTPYMTFRENAPKGGLCIATKTSKDNGDSRIEFLWNSDNI